LSLCEFLLFVNIAMAVTWIGGAAVIQFFALRALQSDDPMRMATLGGDIEWIGNRVFIPASLLAVASGIALVLESDAWGFGDDWVLIGIVLYVITFLAGALFFGPESGRIGKQIQAEGPGTSAVQARIRRILALTRADLVLLFLIIFDMSVKPGFGDAALWIAVLVAAAVAFVLVRNGLAAQMRGAPATN